MKCEECNKEVEEAEGVIRALNKEPVELCIVEIRKVLGKMLKNCKLNKVTFETAEINTPSDTLTAVSKSTGMISVLNRKSTIDITLNAEWENEVSIETFIKGD